MFNYREILSFLRKEFTWRDILLVCLILTSYFALRLINLDGFPIFSDEGIYLNWAKIAANDANWRFISLTDGKQPLQTWMTIPFLKLFEHNALFAGRLVAVTTGFVALVGLFVLLRYLFGKRAAYIGSVLYVIAPYFVFYDRMALIDSGVNASFIWIFFFSVWLVRTNRLDVALLFGLTAGIALLAKSSVRLFLALSAFAPILMWPMKNRKKFIDYSVNYLLLLGIAVFIGLIIYNIQRLSPFFHYINEKNATFILTPKEFIANPFQVVFRNIPLIPYYVFSELSYVIGFLGLFGMFVLYRKDWKMATYFLAWIGISYSSVAFFAEVLFPRYIIFMPTLLLILAAYGLSAIKNKKALAFSLAAVGVSVIYFNYTLLFDYKNIPFPPVDRGQYIEDWPSGWGAKEIMEYARTASKSKPVIILAEGNFGMSGDVLNSLRRPDDRIIVDGRWPLNLEDVKDAQKLLDKNTVLLVFPHRTEFPPDWPVKMIQKYEKPGGKSALYLLELTK